MYIIIYLTLRIFATNIAQLNIGKMNHPKYYMDGNSCTNVLMFLFKASGQLHIIDLQLTIVCRITCYFMYAMIIL